MNPIFVIKKKKKKSYFVCLYVCILHVWFFSLFLFCSFRHCYTVSPFLLNPRRYCFLLWSLTPKTKSFLTITENYGNDNDLKTCISSTALPGATRYSPSYPAALEAHLDPSPLSHPTESDKENMKKIPLAERENAVVIFSDRSFCVCFIAVLCKWKRTHWPTSWSYWSHFSLFATFTLKSFHQAGEETSIRLDLPFCSSFHRKALLTCFPLFPIGPATPGSPEFPYSRPVIMLTHNRHSNLCISISKSSTMRIRLVTT